LPDFTLRPTWSSSLSVVAGDGKEDEDDDDDE